MAVRLTHRQRPDLQSYTIIALGQAFAVTGQAALTLAGRRLTVPDRIPYSYSGYAATLTLGNLEPSWTTVPTITFTQGTADTRDLTQYVTNWNASLHQMQYASSVTAPTGVSLVSTGSYSYNGVGVAATSPNVQIEIVDTAEADWITRSTATGVLNATLFESAADVNKYRWTNGVGHDPSPSVGSMGTYCRWNATDGILGNGCLELEAHPTSNTTSYFWFPFDSTFVPPSAPNVWNGAGQNRGPGQGFYVQLRFKTNCEGSGSTGGGGRKQWSVSRLENSYTFQEMVVQDTLYRGVFQMYQGYGPSAQYQGFETSVPPSDFNFQPNSAYGPEPTYCSYQQVGIGNRANCWTHGVNEWTTYLMYVLPSNEQTANGQVTMWAWRPGMLDYVKIIERTNFYMRYDGAAQAFNALLLWIYETGRTAGPTNQKQWYDQVIVSTNFIARPTS